MLRSVPPTPSTDSEPTDEVFHDEVFHLVEMGGANVVIRAARSLDLALTESLVAAVNAANAAGATAVVDPHTHRCDDQLAAFEHFVTPARPCPDDCRAECRPSAAEVAWTGHMRLYADESVWTIDLERGRLCRTDPGVDVRFVQARDWDDVIAVHVGPNRLRATCRDGLVVSAPRRYDHRPLEPACA